MRSFLNKAVLGAIAFATISGVANAQFTNLVEGGAQVTPPLQVSSPVAGTTFSQFLNTPFEILSNGQGVTGNFFSAAYLNGTTFDFYYQVEVLTITGGAGVTNITTSDFSSFLTQVAQDGDGVNGFTFTGSPFVTGGEITDTAERDGGTIRFDFSGSEIIGAGEFSSVLILRTNATTVVTSNGTVTNGAAANAAILAPATAAIVPEANAGLLAGLALPLLGGVAILRRRKK